MSPEPARRSQGYRLQPELGNGTGLLNVDVGRLDWFKPGATVLEAAAEISWQFLTLFYTGPARGTLEAATTTWEVFSAGVERFGCKRLVEAPSGLVGLNGVPVKPLDENFAFLHLDAEAWAVSGGIAQGSTAIDFGMLDPDEACFPDDAPGLRIKSIRIVDAEPLPEDFFFNPGTCELRQLGQRRRREDAATKPLPFPTPFEGPLHHPAPGPVELKPS